MQSTFKPLTKAQRAELEGYVSSSTWFFRALLFAAAVALAAGLLRAILRGLAADYAVLGHPAWWIVPSAALAAALYRVAGRWTGGRRLRAAIRGDLARGEAAVHRVTAVEAIEVEEQEDEGPAFFLLTGDGKTMIFAGQYLDRLKGKGFPWTAFDIVEAFDSKIFFGITAAGDRLTPSHRRPPMTWEEQKRYGANDGKFRIIDVDFASLRGSRSGVAASR